MQEWSYNTLLKNNRWWDKIFTFPCERPEKKDKQYNYFINNRNFSTDTTYVNKCRDEIGMCSIEHEKKLNEFGKENNLFVRFGFSGNF